MVFLMEKKEMIGEIKEKSTATIIKDFTADGAWVEYNSVGEFKGPKYHATHMETAEVKQKMDGTNEWELKAMEMTKEGDAIMITGKGKGMANPMKPNEGTFSGEVTFMTNSPRLSSINNTKGWVEGTTRGEEADIKVWPPKQTASMTAPTM
jgi:hypothetical protein